ncbi:MAG: hypothetical protein ACOYM1_10215 [Methylovulum sp.]
METPLITYNLKTRGRQYRGKERHFHLQKMAETINSPETQERVKHRDMLGYYGHWPRVKYGLNPCEGNEDGALQPALVTTLLTAKDDGTITHKAEFLKTKPGQIAAQLFSSRTGGFSSAIDESTPNFFGFDYVLEPNYSTNRGYQITFDAVSNCFVPNGISLDNIAILDYNDQLDGALAVIKHLNNAHFMTLESLKQANVDKEELLSLLINQKTLDSASSAALSVAKYPAQQLRNDIDFFKSAKLPKISNQENAETLNETRLYTRLRNGY